MVKLALPKLRLGKSGNKDDVDARTAKSKSKKSVGRSIAEKTAVEYEDKVVEKNTNLSVGRDTPEEMVQLTEKWQRTNQQVKNMLFNTSKEMRRLRRVNWCFIIIAIFFVLIAIGFSAYELYEASQTRSRLEKNKVLDSCTSSYGRSHCAYCVKQEKWSGFDHKMECQANEVSCSPESGLDCVKGDEKFKCYVNQKALETLN